MGGGAEWICNYKGMLMLSGSSKTVTIDMLQCRRSDGDGCHLNT